VGVQRGRGYGDARAGENGDWGGGECRACTGLNGGPRLGKADIALASGENGEVRVNGGRGKADGALSLLLSDDPSPSPSSSRTPSPPTPTPPPRRLERVSGLQGILPLRS
jgi:hypothetical protein